VTVRDRRLEQESGGESSEEAAEAIFEAKKGPIVSNDPEELVEKAKRQKLDYAERRKRAVKMLGEGKAQVRMGETKGEAADRIARELAE
jgi:hypothetical protein